MPAKMKKVTDSSIEKYQTTTTTCLCPAHFYNPGKPCKHIVYQREKLANDWTWFPEVPEPQELPLPSFVKKRTSDTEIDELFSEIMTKIDDLREFIKNPTVRVSKTPQEERLLKYNTTLNSCECKGFKYHNKCKHNKYLVEQQKIQ